MLRRAPIRPSLDARFEQIPTLDGLRTISISLVMLGHFINPQFFPGGLGVLIFFVISGFLITRLLLAEQKCSGAGTVSLRNFYLRRVTRLYPVIIAYTVAVVAMFYLLGRANEISATPIMSALFYFSNYYYSECYIAGIKPTLPFSIFWSLSVEEHFYIVFPILFAALACRGRALRLAVAALCILPLLGRLVFAARYPLATEPELHWITYYQTQYRFDSIAFGVLLALLLEVPYWQLVLRRLQHPLALCLAVMAIIGSLLWRDPIFRETLRYTIQSAATVVILYNLLYSQSYLSRAIAGLLNSPPMIATGKLSYSLYLWHFFVGAFASTVLPAGLPIIFEASLEIAASFALAVLSYNLLEMPFLALRQRLRKHEEVGPRLEHHLYRGTEMRQGVAPVTPPI